MVRTFAILGIRWQFLIGENGYHLLSSKMNLENLRFLILLGLLNFARSSDEG